MNPLMSFQTESFLTLRIYLQVGVTFRYYLVRIKTPEIANTYQNFKHNFIKVNKI